MSAEVIEDLVRGSLRRDVNGWAATRVFHVTLPDGGDPTSALYRATQPAQVPNYGDPHPAVPGISVSAIGVAHDELRDGKNFDVSIEYGGDAEGTAPGLENTGIKGIEVSTSTVSTRGFRDKDGELMIVRFEGKEIVLAGREGGIWSPGSAAQTFRDVITTEPIEAEFELPTVTVTVTREKSRPSHVDSLQTAVHTNSSTWGGLGPKRWLSLGIDSNLNSSGTFDWRYLFAVAPVRPEDNTWRFYAEPILRTDSNGTALRLDATLGNGIELFDLYRTADFSDLFGFEIPS